MVFDLGGVLVRIARSWAEACQGAGVPERGLPQDLSAVHAYEKGLLDHEAFLASVARATGNAYTTDEVRRIHAAWVIDEYPRVGGLVDALHAAGVATGILSNTNASHWEIMLPGSVGPSARFPALARVRHRVASHLVAARKPEPEAFAHVEAVANVRGGRVLFFDDLVENCDAARRFGWLAETVDPFGDPVSQIEGHLARRGVAIGPGSAGAKSLQ